MCTLHAAVLCKIEWTRRSLVGTQLLKLVEQVTLDEVKVKTAAERLVHTTKWTELCERICVQAEVAVSEDASKDD